MKLKILLSMLLAVIGLGSLWAETTYYETDLLEKKFGCKNDDGEVRCYLVKTDPLHIEIYSPHYIPSTLDKEVPNILEYINQQGYSVVSSHVVNCQNDNNTLIYFFAVNKKNNGLETIATVNPKSMVLVEQYFPNIASTPVLDSYISTEKSQQELCHIYRGINLFALFNKEFICNKTKERKDEFNTVTEFECNLDEQDPQHETLFSSQSYLATEPFIKTPRKFLKEMIKDKELGCNTYKIFSCQNKDVAVGACNLQDSETFIQVTPRGLFSLSNTDLQNSIIDKEHAEELCNLTWDKFRL